MVNYTDAENAIDILNGKVIEGIFKKCFIAFETLYFSNIY